MTDLRGDFPRTGRCNIVHVSQHRLQRNSILELYQILLIDPKGPENIKQ